MTFTRHAHTVYEGERIRLTRKLRTDKGTFSVGHEFVIKHEETALPFIPFSIFCEDDEGRRVPFWKFDKKWWQLKCGYEVIEQKQ